MKSKKVTLTSLLTTKKPIENETTVYSLPIPFKRKGPGNKLIAVYGTSNVQDFLRNEHKKALKKNLNFYRISLIISSGEIPTGKVSMEDIPEMKFLNIWRLLQDSAREVLKIIGGSSIGKIGDLISLIDKKPYLLDYVWQDERFKHISAITWPASMSKQSYDIRQMVAVKPEDIQEIYIRGVDLDRNKIKISTETK